MPELREVRSAEKLSKEWVCLVGDYMSVGRGRMNTTAFGESDVTSCATPTPNPLPTHGQGLAEPRPSDTLDIGSGLAKISIVH